MGAEYRGDAAKGVVELTGRLRAMASDTDQDGEDFYLDGENLFLKLWEMFPQGARRWHEAERVPAVDSDESEPLSKKEAARTSQYDKIKGKDGKWYNVAYQLADFGKVRIIFEP